MRRSTTVDSASEFPSVRKGHPADRGLSAVEWSIAAVAVAVIACTLGIAAGRLLPITSAPVIAFGGGVFETAGLMAGIVGLSGLLAGAAAGLMRGGDGSVARALGWGAIGAIAGGVGPLLVAATGGRMPAPVGTVVACGIAGLIAALVGCAGHQPSPSTFDDEAGQARRDIVPAVAWVLAVVLVAVGASVIGVAVGQRLPIDTSSRIAVDGNLITTTGLMTALVAVIGLIVGAVAGYAFGAPRRVDAVIRHGLGWAAIGGIAGGLGPLLMAASGGWLSAGTGIVAAWGIAGSIAAVVGYAGHRRAASSSLADPRAGTVRPFLTAVGWVAAAVVVAAAASAVALFAGQLIRKVPASGVSSDDGVPDPGRLMFWLGALYGLVVGAVSGLVVGGRRRFAAALTRGVMWAVIGAVAGGTGPMLVALTDGKLSAPVATMVGCCIAGLLAAVVGFTLRRQPRERIASLDNWPADEALTDRPTPATVVRPVDSRPVVRQWPILMVSAACLVIVIVAPASPAGWPMLAVSMLGFAVAWALAAQDRRLEALEMLLRERLEAARSSAPAHERDIT